MNSNLEGARAGGLVIVTSPWKILKSKAIHNKRGNRCCWENQKIVGCRPIVEDEHCRRKECGYRNVCGPLPRGKLTLGHQTCFSCRYPGLDATASKIKLDRNQYVEESEAQYQKGDVHSCDFST